MEDSRPFDVVSALFFLCFVPHPLQATLVGAKDYCIALMAFWSISEVYTPVGLDKKVGIFVDNSIRL
jgi:hypothetical protein